MPPIALSLATLFGTIKLLPELANSRETAKRPFTARKEPSKPNSPKKTYFSKLEVSIWSVAAKIAIAIGKSKPGPSLRILAGERLTTMCLGGNSKPLFLIAVRTRSLLSLTAVSGSPTISHEGRPAEASTSILIS